MRVEREKTQQGDGGFLPYGIIMQRNLFETTIASGMIKMFTESPPATTTPIGKPLTQKRSISEAYLWICERLDMVEMESGDPRHKKHFPEYIERLKRDVKEIMLPRNSRAKRISQMQESLDALLAQRDKVNPNSWESLNLRRRILAAQMAVDLSRQTFAVANQKGMSSTGSPA